MRILAAAMATLLSGALFAALVFLQLDVIKRRETVDAAFDSQLVARPEIHSGNRQGPASAGGFQVFEGAQRGRGLLGILARHQR